MDPSQSSDSDDEFENDESALFLAAELNIIEVIRFFLDLGVDVNIRNSQQEVPLHRACASNSIQAIDVLLRSGADIESYDRNGNTPLLTAIINQHIETTKLLIEREANVDNRNPYTGMAPLHEAVQQNCMDLVELFVNTGADTMARDEVGYTPLHYAYFYNRPNIEAFLLKHTKDVNCRNSFGQTVLHLITDIEVVDDFFEKLQLLSTYNADLNLQDNDGCTPVHYPRTIAHLCVMLLYGANPDIQDNEGKSARYYLAKDGIDEVESELKALKSKEFCCGYTMCNIIFMDSHELARFVKNDIFLSIKNDEMMEAYPYYGFLLKKQVDKGFRRKQLMETASGILGSKILKELPELCYRDIFKFLTNNELELFNTCDS